MSQFHFRFTYQKNGVKNDSLTLLKFSGQETISHLFNFEIELKSSNINLDEDSILNQPCSIEIYYGDEAKPIRCIHGLVNEFEDINYLPDSTLYRANMVPRIWQLGLFETNEVYLNDTIQDTLSTILKEVAFIQGQDFRFELTRTYRKWPFRLQYNETHLDYLQRIIEREGIYYYFEQSDKGEVIVFCDNNQALPNINQAQGITEVVFQPSSGLNVASQANTISSIICKRQTLPKKVTLRDFNDETPSLDIRGTHIINNQGVGEINLYGLNIISPEEGQQLAEIHANAYLSRQKNYIGEGDVATMAMGHTFKLVGHARDKFNQLTYLLDSIHHEGVNVNEYQAHHLQNSVIVNYNNSFTALSIEHDFAPKRQTVAPEINGTLNAIIDAEGNSGYAELDESGRYKVKLPFDRKDRNGGKASHWVRMMQPYGGTSEGMHFPLRNGTRVLLGFIGGDPDRPFISGTINDSGEQQSIVTAENQTNNIIKTASGNKIELEDKEGKNRIKLQTGDNKTYMHLGSPNHPGDGWVLTSKGMERKEITGGQQIFVAASGASYENASGKIVKIPTRTATAARKTFDDVIDEQVAFAFHQKDDAGVGKTNFNKDTELEGKHLFERRVGDKYLWTAGNEYIYGGGKVFEFGNGYTEIHNGNNIIGEWTTPPEILGANNYKPDNNLVEKKWADTINYQKGNNYSWGDTCDYNFGNGYEENHLVETILDINATKLQYPRESLKTSNDKADLGGPAWTKIEGKNINFTSEGKGAWVSKSFGDAYDYRQGDTLEVVDGHSETQVYGNSYDYHTGNSHEEHIGDSYSLQHGCSDEFFMGGKSEFNLAATTAISLAATSEIVLGLQNEMSLSLSNSTNLGAWMETTVGAKIELNIGPRVEADSIADLRTKVASIDSALTAIESGATGIKNVGTSIGNTACAIGNGALKLGNQMLTMLN